MSMRELQKKFYDKVVTTD